MSKEPITTSQDVRPRRHLPFQLGLVEKDSVVLHVVYGLYALSLVIALPSFLGVDLAYLKRPDIRGSWLGSRVTWQIRMFLYHSYFLDHLHRAGRDFLCDPDSFYCVWADLALVRLPDQQGLAQAFQGRIGRRAGGVFLAY